jgi:hypothetical protein
MLDGDLGLLEGAAYLATGGSLLEVENLVVNGARAHDDEERDPAEDDPLDGHGLGWDGVGIEEMFSAFRTDERGGVINGDGLVAVGEEATGEVGAFASAGHERIEARGWHEEEKNAKRVG